MEILKKIIKTTIFFTGHLIIGIIGGIIGLAIALCVAFGQIPILMYYDFLPGNLVGDVIIVWAFSFIYYPSLWLIYMIIKHAYTETKKQMAKVD